MERKAIVNRKTRETDISLELDLDGSGQYDIDTGVGFFDHMLSGFARHGFFDLKLKVTGDLYVDSHHTIEDTGIVLGFSASYGRVPCALRCGSQRQALSFLGCGVYRSPAR